MKINTISFIPSAKQVILGQTPSFFGRNSLKTDVFQPSLKEVTYRDTTVKGVLTKNITLKDREGNDVPGYIIKNKDEYYACCKDNALCRMKLEAEKDHIFVDELYGQNNKGKYKGAGTELIKCAVEESRRKGHNGVLKLYMAGSQVFYYKNNFRFAEEVNVDNIKGNALLEYCARNNKNFNRAEGFHSFVPLMVLDKKGADALMQNRRLFEESNSQKLYEKIIELPWQTLDTDVDFCDLGENFAIQLIAKDGENINQIACLTGKNEYGRLIPNPTYDRYDEYWEEEAVQDALYEALEYAENNI